MTQPGTEPLSSEPLANSEFKFWVVTDEKARRREGKNYRKYAELAQVILIFLGLKGFLMRISVLNCFCIQSSGRNLVIKKISLIEKES